MSLRRHPIDGWPLDEIFVGVAALRTTRELFARDRQTPGGDWRAWDLYLRVSASLQGCRYATDRLEQAGLVEAVPATRHWGACSYRLAPSNPLVAPLHDLFRAERAIVSGARSGWR